MVRFQVVSCTQHLRVWVDDGQSGTASFLDLLSKDERISAALAAAADALGDTGRVVDDHLASFQQFCFLWTKDLAIEYAAFIAAKPSLEVSPTCTCSSWDAGIINGLSPLKAPAFLVQMFEEELCKYMAVEQSAAVIPAKQVIGSLTLDVQPLKHSLRSEAASWKAQFAKNLHAQGAQDLKVLPRLTVF